MAGYAGKQTVQAIIDETKKLIHPEVAIGTAVPLDENIQLFVNEEEEGGTTADFYTKEEVDAIKNELLTEMGKTYGFKLLTKGIVDDPADHPITQAGATVNYEEQTVRITTNTTKSLFDDGIFFIYCRTEQNPECASYIGCVTMNYVTELKFLCGKSESNFIKVGLENPNTITITCSSVGCGCVYYDIWLLPFVSPV